MTEQALRIKLAEREWKQIESFLVATYASGDVMSIINNDQMLKTLESRKLQIEKQLHPQDEQNGDTDGDL
jgi:DNA-binding TFAR19-related protein (PDSD5 family)